MKRFHPFSVWISHIGLLVLFTTWNAFDPTFELMCLRFRSGTTTPVLAFRDAVASVGWIRPALFLCLVAGVVACFAITLSQMLRRSSKQMRSLKAALVTTALAAAWFGLSINTSQVAWYGKRLQLAWQIEQFESLAGPLRGHWPDKDGELPGIGPFMAYPFGNPSTLVLLQPPSVSSHGPFISAIDRDESGVIRLQLSGIHSGDWVEWHPAASQPRSFSGGLSDRYELASALSLGSGWYLVRYHA